LRRVSLDSIEPGMRLGKSVLNENGMVLLSEDTELTDSIMEKLRYMKVDSVYVKGLTKPEKPKEVMLRELEERFQKVEEAPCMPMIKKVLQEHIEGLYEQA
jgi:hypothetical protein